MIGTIAKKNSEMMRVTVVHLVVREGTLPIFQPTSWWEHEEKLEITPSLRVFPQNMIASSRDLEEAIFCGKTNWICP